MLLMHEGRPIHVGASAPGTEFYDGYLASLRVFARALDESQIKQLATDAPDAEVLIHIDSGRLDDGPVTSWTNSGSLGGEFQPVDRPPTVADVDGRLAVTLEPGQALRWTTDTAVALGEISLLASVWNHSTAADASAVEFVDGDGRRSASVTCLPVPGWHQVAYVFRDGRSQIFHDGQPTAVLAPPPPQTLKEVRLGGSPGFSGSLARVQLFRRALSEAEVSQLYTVWKQERQVPEPSPAAFADGPAAITSNMIAMSAQIGRSSLGSVEYQFTETAGSAGGTSSGWTGSPFFLDDALQPGSHYAYAVRIRDSLGNVTAVSAPVAIDTDPQQFREWANDFSADRDFLTAGTGGTIWDGCLGPDDGSFPEAIRQQDGTLRLQSAGTVWDGGPRRGVFLFKLVTGDFVAQTAVADYAGLTDRRVPGNNDGGLMVRVPEVEDAGPGEDLVQLNFFPIWNQGNMVTSLDSGARPQIGNQLAWDAHRHLQIIRQGIRFHFRTSVDGVHWDVMPGSPVERADMRGRPVQVGVYHASYGNDSSYITFDDFRITTRR
jgi:hypothetical protein